jgi:hypothetical protein
MCELCERDRIALNVGVLIIGSLLWDPDRGAWRNARLRMENASLVRAPIRYGRRSERRGNTYTMVFSRLCEPGQAKVIQCAALVSSARDLITEAEHLWAAERNDVVRRRISGSWGCVALLPHPDRDIPRDLLRGWANRVAEDRNYGNIPQTLEEGRLVSTDGILQIPWPTFVDSNAPVPLDLLLATATHPTLTGSPSSYPSVDAIANAWNADRNNHVEYFVSVRSWPHAYVIFTIHPP